MSLLRLAAEKQSAQKPHNPDLQSSFKVVLIKNLKPKFHCKTQTSRPSERRISNFMYLIPHEKKNNPIFKKFWIFTLKTWKRIIR